MNKSNSIISNIIWRFLERTGAQMVSLIVSIILARLLEPDIYGTIALITVLTTIFQVFVDSGLGNALIQKKEADQLDYSSVFWANIIFCSVLYILLFAISPNIAVFFGDEKLTIYIRVLGLTVPISGVKNIQQAYVSKKMMFRKFFFSTLAGTIVAGILGVVVALCGYGIWALIVQQLVNMFVDTALLWCIVEWKPSFSFSVLRLKKLLKYGWKLLFSSLIDTGYTQLRTILIGKRYTETDLAFYNQGERLPYVAIYNVTRAIDSVLFPAMSSVQTDRNRVKDLVRKAISMSVFVLAPIMIGMAAAADSLIEIVLTPKWLPCVFYLRIICIAYIFYPIHTANLNAIKALGRSDIFLKLEIYKKVIGIIVIVCCSLISVRAIAYSLLFTEVVDQIINSWPNAKLLDYSYLEQLKDIAKSLLIALIMGIIVFTVGMVFTNIYIKFLIQIAIGIMVYIILTVAFNSTMISEVTKLLFRIKKGEINE